MTFGSILLQVLPVEEEVEDLETVALALELMRQTGAALEADGYEARPVSDGARGEMLEIIRHLADAAAANKTELLALITAAVAALGKLSEHRRVGKIEISQGNRKLALENADRATVERMVREFLAQTDTDNTAPVQVTGRVSKRKRRS